MSYPELNFGGRKWSSQCLVKSDGPKTCSYGFGGSLASMVSASPESDLRSSLCEYPSHHTLAINNGFMVGCMAACRQPWRFGLGVPHPTPHHTTPPHPVVFRNRMLFGNCRLEIVVGQFGNYATNKCSWFVYILICCFERVEI